VGASISSDDLELKNETTGQTIAPSLTHVDYSPGNHVAVWTFPGFAHGMLPDGNYTARLKASQVTIAGGGQLDGNGDGLGGDDFLTTFFQLKGDTNHNRVVDTTDLRTMMSHVGTINASLEQGDLNADGKIDIFDFQAMEQAFGHSLPPVMSVPQPAPVAVAKPAPIRVVMTTPLAPVVRPLFSTDLIKRPMDYLDVLVKRPGI